MKAYLKHYRQSPRKVRLVANLIRGKSVGRARSLLSFTNNKSAGALKKLVESAVANAGLTYEKANDLVVKDVQVDQGIAMKRIMPMSRGRANQFRRRTSRIALSLGEEVKTPEKKKAVASKKKTTTKVAKKKPLTTKN